MWSSLKGDEMIRAAERGPFYLPPEVLTFTLRWGEVEIVDEPRITVRYR